MSSGHSEDQHAPVCHAGARRDAKIAGKATPKSGESISRPNFAPRGKFCFRCPPESAVRCVGERDRRGFARAVERGPGVTHSRKFAGASREFGAILPRQEIAGFKRGLCDSSSPDAGERPAITQRLLIAGDSSKPCDSIAIQLRQSFAERRGESQRLVFAADESEVPAIIRRMRLLRHRDAVAIKLR